MLGSTEVNQVRRAGARVCGRFMDEEGEDGKEGEGGEEGEEGEERAAG